MELDIELIHVYNLLNKNIIFQRDIDSILRNDYVIVSYSEDAKFFEIYSFERSARFDTENIYQQIKHVYKNHANHLNIMFPSADVLRSFTEELPSGVETTSRCPSSQEHPKMILLELFNGFRTNKEGIHYYYYSRP